MEGLSQTQIILLCILISFVTSIATGIMTFSLLSEAPQTITQTINRVVEKTIQTVTPSASSSTQVITQVEQVVVAEQDFVSETISSLTPHIVQLYRNEKFVTEAIIVKSDGTMFALYNGNTDDMYGVFSDGVKIDVEKVSEEESGFITLAPVSVKEPREYKPAAQLSHSISLGQQVIVVNLIDSLRASVGRIAKTGTLIEVDAATASLQNGALLFSIKGEFIGQFGSQGKNSTSGFVSPVAPTVLGDATSAEALVGEENE
jgi:hypothetical protein